MQQKKEWKLPHFHNGLIQAPRFPDLSLVQIPVSDLKAEIDINWHLEKIKKMGSEKSHQPNMDSFTLSYRESQQSDFDLEYRFKESINVQKNIKQAIQVNFNHFQEVYTEFKKFFNQEHLSEKFDEKADKDSLSKLENLKADRSELLDAHLKFG